MPKDKKPPQPIKGKLGRRSVTHTSKNKSTRYPTIEEHFSNWAGTNPTERRGIGGSNTPAGRRYTGLTVKYRKMFQEQEEKRRKRGKGR